MTRSLRDGAALCDGVVHLVTTTIFTDGGAENRSQRHRAMVRRTRERSTLSRWRLLGLLTSRPRTTSPSRHPSRMPASRMRCRCPQRCSLVVLRFAPTVHGDGDHGSSPHCRNRSREARRVTSARANCWPAVHRLDAARLVRLTLEARRPHLVTRSPNQDCDKAIAEPLDRTRRARRFDTSDEAATTSGG